jgi:hypothetical protein
MAHASTIGAEDEISRAAVFALSTGNGCGAQARDPLPQRDMVVNVAPFFYDCAGKLMPKNDRGVVAERVVKDMKVGSADSTIGNFKFNFAVSASRFLYFPYTDVAFATRILDQSFHVGKSRSRSFQ